MRARPGRGRATRTTSPVGTRRSTRLPRWFDTRSSRSFVKTTLGTMGTSPFKMCHAREPRKEILGEIGFVPRARAASETEIMNLGLPFVKMCARHGKQSVENLVQCQTQNLELFPPVKSSQISFVLSSCTNQDRAMPAWFATHNQRPTRRLSPPRYEDGCQRRYHRRVGFHRRVQWRVQARPGAVQRVGKPARRYSREAPGWDGCRR